MDEEEPKPHLFWLKATGILVAVVLLFFGARAAYHALMPKWLVSKAITAKQNGDLVGASLRIRRALQINSQDPGAVRWVADSLDEVNAPEALFWRFRSYDLNQNLEQGAALVACALKSGDLGAARSVLEKLRQRYGEDQVLALQADLALVERRFEEAASLYDKAEQQSPKTKEFAYRAAHIRLLHGSVEEAFKAERFLEELAQQPALGYRASKALVDYCLQTGQLYRALRINTEILSNPQSVSWDKLTQLTLLQRTDETKFRSYLAELQAQLGKKPETVAQLASKLNEIGLQRESMLWVLSLPKEVVEDPEVRLAAASSYLNLRDWEALSNFAANGHWGRIEYIRLALMARAAREKGLNSKDLWERAVKESAGQDGAAFALAKTVDAWGWRPEAKELRWQLAQGNGSAAKWALGVLYQEAAKEKDLPELVRISSRLVAINPADEKMTNNLAMFLLLMETERSRPLKLMQELYSKSPGVPEIASTYALALVRNGKAQEALSVMQALANEQLQRPDMAFSMGVVLAELGQQERARPYLELAATRNGMFEQEIRLLKKAGWKPENNP